MLKKKLAHGKSATVLHHHLMMLMLQILQGHQFYHAKTLFKNVVELKNIHLLGTHMIWYVEIIKVHIKIQTLYTLPDLNIKYRQHFCCPIIQLKYWMVNCHMFIGFGIVEVNFLLNIYLFRKL